MTRFLGVLGSLGFARELMPLVRAHALPSDRLVFVDRVAGGTVNYHGAVEEDGFFSRAGDKLYATEITERQVRRKPDVMAYNKGATGQDVRASSSEMLDGVTIGPGAALCVLTIITSNVRIGPGFHLNLHSYVAHDCAIGDYLNSGPNVACNGNTIVEDGAYFGTGAAVQQC